MESLFRKVTEEIFTFHVSVKNTNICISMFRKLVFFYEFREVLF